MPLFRPLILSSLLFSSASASRTSIPFLYFINLSQLSNDFFMRLIMPSIFPSDVCHLFSLFFFTCLFLTLIIYVHLCNSFSCFVQVPLHKSYPIIFQVNEICHDIKKLDCAKTHLQASITSLKRLQMLITAVGQLEVDQLGCISHPLT